MPSISKVIALIAFLSFGIFCSQAKQHPIEKLGESLFTTFKTNDFNAFYQRSIFSLNETTFQAFLKDLRNKSLREDLITQHRIPFPPEVKTLDQKWHIAFKRQRGFVKTCTNTVASSNNTRDNRFEINKWNKIKRYKNTTKYTTYAKSMRHI